jgi:hypothetical protein
MGSVRDGAATDGAGAAVEAAVCVETTGSGAAAADATGASLDADPGVGADDPAQAVTIRTHVDIPNGTILALNGVMNDAEHASAVKPPHAKTHRNPQRCRHLSCASRR